MKFVLLFVLYLSGMVSRCPAMTYQAAAASPELDHLALQVHDLDKSAAFYEKVMGLERLQEPFHDGRHVWMRLGPHIALHLIRTADPVTTHPIELHFCLRVVSLEAFLASLDRAHVAYRDMKGSGKMQTRVDGVKQTYVQDPDGYWIEVNDAKY